MSKASRAYKKQYGGSLSEYRRERRLLQAEDRDCTQAFRELRNFHRRFFIENSWIPKEERRKYMYSPMFWDWCYNNISRYRRQRNGRK